MLIFFLIFIFYYCKNILKYSSNKNLKKKLIRNLRKVIELKWRGIEEAKA